MLRRVPKDDVDYLDDWGHPGGQMWIDEAAIHAVVGDITEDPGDVEARYLLGRMVDAAFQLLEADTARAYTPGPWQLTLDRFPSCGEPIEVRLAPVTSIDEIRYIAADGTEQTLDPAEYLTDLASEPARIAPAYGTTWPTTRRQLNAVTVDLTAGYSGVPATTPPAARQAILLLVGHWFANRESVGQVGNEIALAYRSLRDSLKWTL